MSNIPESYLRNQTGIDPSNPKNAEVMLILVQFHKKSLLSNCKATQQAYTLSASSVNYTRPSTTYKLLIKAERNLSIKRFLAALIEQTTLLIVPSQVSIRPNYIGIF